MKKIGFIGAGNMAEALIKGLLSSGLTTCDSIIASDVIPERLDLVHSRYGVKISKRNTEVVEFSDFIVIAVKPDTVEHVLRETREFITQEKIIISIAAGIRMSQIISYLGKEGKIVRVMPNTPALVLAGASVLYPSPSVTQKEIEEVKRIFEAVGITYITQNEGLLNGVTGLSGSGPAFAAIFIEALADGGVKVGLPRDMALRLAAQTVYGTAKMVLDGLHPAELKDRVASPGGTTIEGIKELESRGLRGGVISAVEAAARRSKELAKEGK